MQHRVYETSFVTLSNQTPLGLYVHLTHRLLVSSHKHIIHPALLKRNSPDS